MGRIKTRESTNDIKVLDKAAVVSERMKTALVRSKDQAENLMDDGQISPSEYAEDKIRYAAEDVTKLDRYIAQADFLAKTGLETVETLAGYKAEKEKQVEALTQQRTGLIYDTGVTAEYGDQLLTLSTCEYTYPNGRFVVVAKKV